MFLIFSTLYGNNGRQNYFGQILENSEGRQLPSSHNIETFLNQRNALFSFSQNSFHISSSRVCVNGGQIVEADF